MIDLYTSGLTKHDIILYQKRKDYHKHKEQRNAQRKQFRIENPEHMRDQGHRAWIKRDKEKVRIQNREYSRKYRLNPHNRIATNLRSRLLSAVKYFGVFKSDKTQALVGCTYSDLVLYLQSKLKDGMTLDNYGKWHIDHIIPCIKFDLTNPEEQKKCFHYTNLQPLWAHENLIKPRK